MCEGGCLVQLSKYRKKCSQYLWRKLVCLCFKLNKNFTVVYETFTYTILLSKLWLKECINIALLICSRKLYCFFYLFSMSFGYLEGCTIFLHKRMNKIFADEKNLFFALRIGKIAQTIWIDAFNLACVWKWLKLENQNYLDTFKKKEQEKSTQIFFMCALLIILGANFNFISISVNK